jgi:repressor LexA
MPKQAQGSETERGLTRAQQRTLDAIRSYIDKEGIPPSIRDVCQRLGQSSTSSVQHHFRNLKELGAIELREGVPRSVRVLWPRPNP